MAIVLDRDFFVVTFAFRILDHPEPVVFFFSALFGRSGGV
jgi:hypothetical protein